MKRNRRRHRPLRIGRVLSYLTLWAVGAFVLLPIVLTFLYSFFPQSEIKNFLGTRNNYSDEAWMPVLLSPSMASIRQYYTILIEQPMYLNLFVNSAGYTAAILLGQMAVIPMTAYALSRFRFYVRDLSFFFVLVLMILPFHFTMAPSVITMRTLGLMETSWAVILPMVFSPFYIFLLRQFMIGLPNELLEAGMIDGAGTWRCFVHVVVPVCRPIIGAAAALSFADCWNMVEQPLIYLAGRQSRMPLSVLFNQIGTDNSEIAFAGAALYILPALLIYGYFQEDVLLGIQLSELK